MHNVRRALAAWGMAELFVATACLVAISILNAAGVLMRYVFNSSIVWSEEVSLLLLNVMVFLGAAVMYKARAYVVLEYFFRKFSVTLQHRLTLATWALACVFAAIAALYGASLYPLQINTTSFILELPRFYGTSPLIIGCTSIACVSAFYLWLELRHQEALAILPGIEIG